jgi:hypothetical protein
MYNKKGQTMFSEQDKTLIEELGLQNLSEEQQALQLQKFYQTLQKKVGMALEDKLSDEQLVEFEKVSGSGDNTATADWLRRAIPDYDQVVVSETADLKQSIKQAAKDYRRIIHEDS